MASAGSVVVDFGGGGGKPLCFVFSFDLFFFSFDLFFFFAFFAPAPAV
jgi:hypothetical protein